MPSPRQTTWLAASDKAASEGDDLAAGLFGLIALPNDRERSGHNCREHALGFRKGEVRGFKCGICREVI